MKELQTVALGLVVVFLDVGSPDWVADPLGWLLVLVGIAAVKERITDYGYLLVTGWVCLALSVVTWPPDSVPHLDDTVGFFFSLPTLAFCFLLSDSLTDVTRPDLATRFRVISWVYALVTVLPLLPLLVDWEWLGTPAQVLAIVVNVVLVISLFSASDEDAVLAAAGGKAEEPGSRTGRATSGPGGGSSSSGSTKAKVTTAADKTKDRAKETVDTVSDNVRTAAKDTAQSVKGTAQAAKDTAQAVKDKAANDGAGDQEGRTGPRTGSGSKSEPVDRDTKAEAEAEAEGRHKA